MLKMPHSPKVVVVGQRAINKKRISGEETLSNVEEKKVTCSRSGTWATIF